MYIKREERKDLVVHSGTSKKWIIFLPIAAILIIFFGLIKNFEKNIGTIKLENKQNQSNSINESDFKFGDESREFLDLAGPKNNGIKIDDIINQSNSTNPPRRGGGGGGGGGNGGGGNPGGNGNVDPIIIEENLTLNDTITNSSSNNAIINNTNNQTNNNSTTNQTNNNQTSNNTNNNQSNNSNNSSNTNQTANQTNSTENGNNITIENKRSLKKIKSGFKIKKDGQDVSESELFGGKNRFRFDKGGFSISEFDIDFSNLNRDIDFSDVTADVDFNIGKTFLHSSKGLLKNITLYIPRLAGQNGVLICSNASSFSQIHVGCGNDTGITSEYILTEGDPNLRVSSNGLYFLVTGITGTGGNGVNITAGTPQTTQADPAGNNSAFAGNITFLGITAFSTTQTWQGYFGNVSGTIQLGDASDNILYNWSLAEPAGEIYSSTNSTINWANLQCFNFTANTTGSAGSNGETNLAGTNLSVLETRFGILTDDADGVNETFSFSPAGDEHDNFFIASLQFSAGECLSTKPFNSSGASAVNQFEEVLLYDPVGSSVLFTSILEEGTLNGFNAQDNDFQMLVLEDGHGTDVTTTTYFFFSELE